MGSAKTVDTSSTSNNTYSPTQQALQAYQGLVSNATAWGQNAYTKYGNSQKNALGSLVAPINAVQQAATNTYGNITNQLGNLGNVFQPYYNGAFNATAAGQNALSPQNFSSSIQQYMNPYNQNVIDTTMKNVNQQNQLQSQGAIGSAIKSGNAFGGDRMGLGLDNLANQQAMASDQTIAGLEKDNYNQAAGLTQQNAQNQFQAGQQYASMGTGAQQASLMAPTAQLGANQQYFNAGTQAQNTQQQADTAQYQQFQNSIAFPYQQNSWLAGILGAIGPQEGYTTTGSGTQQQPAGNTASSLLGAGVAALGFLKRGGRVSGGNFAAGGASPFAGNDSISIPGMNANGLIPPELLAGINAKPPVVQQYQQPNQSPVPNDPGLSSSQYNQLGKAGQNASNWLGTQSDISTLNADTAGMSDASLWGEAWKRGGAVPGYMGGGSIAGGGVNSSLAGANWAAPSANDLANLNATAAGAYANGTFGSMGGGAQDALASSFGTPVGAAAIADQTKAAATAAQAAADAANATTGSGIGKDVPLNGTTPKTKIAVNPLIPATDPNSPTMTMRRGGTVGYDDGGAVDFNANPYGDLIPMNPPNWEAQANALPAPLDIPAPTGNLASGYANQMPAPPVANPYPTIANDNSTPLPQQATGTFGGPSFGDYSNQMPQPSVAPPAAPMDPSLASAYANQMPPPPQLGPVHAPLSSLPAAQLGPEPVVDRLPLTQYGGPMVGNFATDAQGNVIDPATQKPTGVVSGLAGVNPDARGMRNNNPGNLESNSWTASLPGYVGTDGRFAKFATPEQGLAALDRNLQGYGERGLNTPASIIARWSPPGESPANKAAYGNYVNAVSATLGIGPNDPIDMNDPNQRIKVAGAIAKFENGAAPWSEDGSPSTALAYDSNTGRGSLGGGALGAINKGTGNMGDFPAPGAQEAQQATTTEQKPFGLDKLFGANGGLFNLSPEARMALVSAGLGMMASRSPFLGQAIGEGGLAGMKTYVGQQQLNRQNANTQSEIGLRSAQTGEIQTKNELQKQQLHFMLEAAGILNGDKSLNGSPASPASSGASSGSGGVSADGIHAAVKATTQQMKSEGEAANVAAPRIPDDQNPTVLRARASALQAQAAKVSLFNPQMSERLQTNAQQLLSQANEINKTGRISYPDGKGGFNIVNAPGFNQAETQTRGAIADAEATAKANADARITMPAQNAKDIANKDIETAHNDSTQAQSALYRLQEMDEQAKNLPTRGFLAPGAYASERGNLARGLNTISSIFGGQPIADPNNIAALEEMGKDKFRLGAELSRQIGGKEPGFIVQSAVTANPGAENSAIGYRRIVNGLRQSMLYRNDYANFLPNYYHEHGNTLGAPEAFQKLHPVSSYVERALTSTVDPRDAAAMQAVKNAPEAVAVFDKKYGKGTAALLAKRGFDVSDGTQQ